MAYNREKVWRTLEVLVVLAAVSGIALTLYFVFVRLRFFFGVDYHMVHAWMAGYRETGVFYDKNSIFYNVPLAVAAFGPWLFLSVATAVTLKFIQTLTLAFVCVFLLFKLRPDILKSSNSGPFVFFLILGSFFMAQLFYLNIYMEVTACLMAFLYFEERGRERWAAFFLSLAVIFKVFLAPLFVVPLLTRKFRLLGWALLFLAGLGCVSVALFGMKIHMGMVRAMGENYGLMRLHGISYPYVADGFAGWQDMFNKLSVSGIMERRMVFPLTLTFAGLYVCLFLYTCFLIYRKSGSEIRKIPLFGRVFATVAVFCIGFNFRFDHGAILFSALPFFGDLQGKDRGLLLASLTLITLSRLLVEQVLAAMGLAGAQAVMGKLFYVLSFQFIGINLLVFTVVNHWAVADNQKEHAS